MGVYVEFDLQIVWEQYFEVDVCTRGLGVLKCLMLDREKSTCVE